MVSKKVNVAMRIGEITAIENGIAEGDQIIVSDLSPAVEGMRLSPIVDVALAAQIKTSAEGGV
ncbi:hypothetical protein QUF70_14385 [Desulfobacterales bacterium HSG17]|nr:hypothetical protein [Desulfobacterales bacterium HSG17]